MTVRIRDYVLQHPRYEAYDPQAPVVAAVLIDVITSASVRLRVEHVGSSSVPGCGGKAYIDLMVLYDDGELESAKRTLDELGFQRQLGRDPWPENRPMRVGQLEHAGRQYPIHAHVVAGNSPEIGVMLGFRDRLRADGTLVRGYEAEKRRVLREGVIDGVDYAERKGAFVERVLAAVSKDAVIKDVGFGASQSSV